ncbi:ATP12 family chaperone protein [Dichotomicrobium thermohalophilum]|uniref:Chaperone required for assembly of F1-ATPase n=1 Tax=Dichotomicrobium thermohalophilum TaxID=933063 RepID=A0A397Q7P9_9HYPH|nr:ATP12 family protein [Dichotomicrobium thermohalophilum]RIA56519.1 chaperone required for assembly of F1-ATPase [Dichotomicrobium thermohalophilum]
MNQQKPSPKEAGRFYDTAWAEAGEAGWHVMLDGRPVHTPQRARLTLPTAPLAEAVAAEWEAQEAEIKPTAMPLTRLANSAIDRAAPRRDEVIEGLVAYGETDLLCYRAEWPEKLTILQAEAWDPILDWARELLGADLRVVAGVMHTAQPSHSIAAMDEALRTHDDFALTAMNQMTTLTASLVLTFAIVYERLSVEEAWRVAHVDEDWQIAQWGEDAAARQRREAQWADMAAAARFLRLSRQS